MRDCDVCNTISETRVVRWEGPGRYRGETHVCRSCYLATQTPEEARRAPWYVLPPSSDPAPKR